ncbi:hypothetical protein AAH678_30420 [Sodalis endosymbiont of Spalangia cameroni]|uniref:hypothetical protein n=1 Tax=Sodalis praecaptivus TaxID=1239307 RepID=UPI0031F8E7DF
MMHDHNMNQDIGGLDDDVMAGNRTGLWIAAGEPFAGKTLMMTFMTAGMRMPGQTDEDTRHE